MRLSTPASTHDMVMVGIEDCRLTATASLVWSGDLPRPLQQILFDTADGSELTGTPHSVMAEAT
jgi:hypothetical protein